MPSGFRTAEFEFALPPELIAQEPAAARDQSRLLVVQRTTQSLQHRQFPDLLDYLRPGDVLVLNNSRVVPARLRGRNARSGGQFEMLLLEETAPNQWWAMVRPGKRAQLSTIIEVLDNKKDRTQINATVEEINPEGHRRLRFTGTDNILLDLDALGEIPLPPYIERTTPRSVDRERYQTVYASPPGSVAAPTAGLHFTPQLLETIRSRGVSVCFVTLHVGLGTFAPVKAETIAEHRMHEERFEISTETAETIARGRTAGGRIIAVGTTSLRVLESAASTESGGVPAGRGSTSIFIYPPYRFKIVDALLTNFHLPRSTLLMLAAAFAQPGETGGVDFILRAYQEAVAQRYRFFSYGDAMLLI